MVKFLKIKLCVAYNPHSFDFDNQSLKLTVKLSTSTQTLTPKDTIRKWHLIDATNQNLGRLATQVATLLRGKHKAEYTPNMDMGDFVIIVNAKNINATGNKMQDKVYYKHTGYIGHMKSIALKDLLEKDAKRVIESAVKGMIPRNPLGRAMMKKLKIYNESNHPHQSQQPENFNLS